MLKLEEKIRDKSATIGIVGLGYIGLPLVVAFAEAGFKVLGFDIQQKRVDAVNEGKSYITDVSRESLETVVANNLLEATTKQSRLKETDAICICVPTPLTKTKDPDLSYVIRESREISKHLQPGQLIILESTTYPGGLSGAVSMLDKSNCEILVHKVPNHSIYSLTVSNDKLIAGTSILGEGARSQAREAKLIIFRMEPFGKEFEIVPVPLQNTIYSLVCSENNIYGLTGGGYLFAFDPNKRQVLWIQRSFDRAQYMSSLGHPNLIVADGGTVYGTTGYEFFQLDTVNRQVTILKKAETGYLVEGDDGCIYLNMGTNLFRYQPRLN